MSSAEDRLGATPDEVLIEEADLEVGELSDHSRPVVIENINEA